MRRPLRERTLSTVVILPTALIVIVLALLQYRWTNQVSEATSLRLADSLQMSMVNWHLDFFRGFSELCLTMRVDPDNGIRGDLGPYVRRFSEWKASAAYPDLVSALYILPDAQEHTQVLHLDPSTGRFESEGWPARFAGIREELRRPDQGSAPTLTLSAPSAATPGTPGETPKRDFADRFYPGGPLEGWLFEPSLPALLHRIDPSSDALGKQQGTPRAEGWILIELNETVIRTRMLSDLAQRYFQGTDGLDYQVAVVAGRPPRNVIYSSDPGFGAQDVADADGTLDIFGRHQDNEPGTALRIFHAPSENKEPATAVRISWFPLLQQTPMDQDWQLVVRHRRGGALGAFAAEMRRRDLTISFGVLFLLVICMALLVVASNRAQRLARLQMDFVTAVSHELRTPLSVISSAAENIVQGVVQGKQQLTQYGSVIGGQARKLSGLVEQILLFAAIREGHQRYSLRPLTVAEVIDAALAGTSGLIEEARFQVELDLPPGLPQVTGDLSALSRCVQNLITNALKYGSEQRWIGIRAHVANHGASGKEIQISVSDRGMGIEPADLPHIFEPFYRSRAVTEAQIHGTGLGLPLAKSIAEAMKGQLTVTSSPGRGSTFTLHLLCIEPPIERAGAEVRTAVAP